MKTNDAFENIRIASPCTARWGHMVGDERVRYCLQCQKHVYNFSAMSADDVARVVREKEGRLCARFYRRADGTMLTADCPLGAGRFWRQVKSRLWASAALVAVATSAFMGIAARSESSEVSTPGKLSYYMDRAFMKVRIWLRLPMPPGMGGIKVRMGQVCVLPPPNNPNTTNTAQ